MLGIYITNITHEIMEEYLDETNFKFTKKEFIVDREEDFFGRIL